MLRKRQASKRFRTSGFVSGYSESVAERRPEDSVYISKPFTPVSLARNVRNALDRTAPD